MTKELAATNIGNNASLLFVEKTWEHDVGSRIAEARRTAGLTQEQLADLLGVSQRSLQDYEGGKTVPWKHIRAIAGLTQVEPDWLLHGERTDDRSILFEVLERVRRIEERLGALEPHTHDGKP